MAFQYFFTSYIVRMRDKRDWILRHLHLLISIAIVVPTGIIYGVTTLVPLYLNIQVDTIDLANMLKANMFLYFCISAVWILGIWKSNYWKTATQLNILFMFSLAIGRILSMMTDGLPSGGYIFGLMAELTIGLFSIYQLRRFEK